MSDRRVLGADRASARCGHALAPNRNGPRWCLPISSHLVAGATVCGSCGATIAQVSGKNDGYYGSLAATKGACDNKTLVRRTATEKVILEAVKDELADPEHVSYVLHRVEEEVAKAPLGFPTR